MPDSCLRAALDAVRPTEHRTHTASLCGRTLSTAFQPIYSLSHSRAVGHEALLRAIDENGNPVSPLRLFEEVPPAEAAWCDTLSRVMHLFNFAEQAPPNHWLFLNIRPEALMALAEPAQIGFLTALLHRMGISPSLIVLELLESAIPPGEAFLSAIGTLRSHGMLIALDDFGAGHSNFDRVWRIQPDIVKLDRSLITAMAEDPGRLRAVSQTVSVLHEAEALVLMEGIETAREAMLALESDVDLVQGFYFARPHPELDRRPRHEGIVTLHGELARFRAAQRERQKSLLAPFQNAIGYAGVLLSAGRSLDEAARSFLALPGALVCFVLDDAGFQVGPNVGAEDRHPAQGPDFSPLTQAEGACWARRPYFKRALQSPGRVQVTRPYRTLGGRGMTITVSYAFQQAQPVGTQAPVWRVVCGDVSWAAGGVRHDGPPFLTPAAEALQVSAALHEEAGLSTMPGTTDFPLHP